MSDIGPKQGSLFSTAAKQSRGRKDGPARPQDARVAGAAGAGNAEPAPAAVAPRPLYIGPVERQAIAALIERARAKPVVLAEMQRRAAELKRGMTPPPSLNREFTIKIPQGFTATYTHEEQPAPLNWTRHLSIAADRAGRAPHPVAVDWLIREFGFRAQSLREIEIRWMEPLGNNRQAVNLVEPLVPVELVSDTAEPESDLIFDDTETVEEC